MNKDLDKVTAWSECNGLHINPAKTQSLIIGYPRLLSQINLSDLPQLKINNIPIQFVKKAKYLGVTLNERLTWTDHVNETCGRVFRALHSLRRLLDSLPRNIRKLLVQSLIVPYFDYCDTILTDLTDEMTLKLDRALNACVRFIFDLRRDDHVTQYYRALSWVRAKDRRNNHLLRQVHSLIQTQTPSYLADAFKFINNSSTRSELLLRPPIHRTTVANKSFLVAGCRAWNSLNSLPIEVRRLRGVGEFRRAVEKLNVL